MCTWVIIVQNFISICTNKFKLDTICWIFQCLKIHTWQFDYLVLCKQMHLSRFFEKMGTWIATEQKIFNLEFNCESRRFCHWITNKKKPIMSWHFEKKCHYQLEKTTTHNHTIIRPAAAAGSQRPCDNPSHRASAMHLFFRIGLSFLLFLLLYLSFPYYIGK